MLRLVVDGLLNKQIAQRLGITERTVKAHLTSAYQRIGVADRTQAALWVQRHDLGGSVRWASALAGDQQLVVEPLQLQAHVAG